MSKEIEIKKIDDNVIYDDPFRVWAEEVASVQNENTQLYIEEGQDILIHDSLIAAREKEISEYFEEVAINEKDDITNISSSNNSEEDKETEEEMAESQYAEESIYEFLVRGAILKCTCGSHCRRLNLPESHNYYMNGRPLMNENDSLPGAKEVCESKPSCNKINIPYFGVCEHGKSPEKTVLLKKDKKRDPFGNIIEEEKKKENIWNKKIDDNVKGHVCEPKILTRWLCPDESCIVDGAASIKGDSFLVCEYGGIIEVLQSGQSMEDNIDNI